MNNLKKLGLTALAGSLAAVSANAGEKIKIIIVKKLTSLKLFLINTPIIKRNNNDIDKNNSGNI